jgi:alpha-galactosidase
MNRFPEVLFESCSSGGARFDPGMLHNAQQTWTSDDTDAMERVKIQYGTSYVYSLCTMGAHVSEVPNQQVGLVTPFKTRGNVAMFGLLGII